MRRRMQTLTAKALDAYARSRAEIERHRDQPPRPGDLFVLAATANLPVEWAVLGHDPEGPDGLLAVAADSNPLAGSADVTVAAADGGPLTLRCAFAVRLGSERFESARRTGFLAPGSLERARRKRAEIEAGALTGSMLEEETDAEPEYEDWVESVPEKAQTAVLVTPERRPDDAEPALAAILAHPRRAPAWRVSGIPYAIAAAVLLVVALGLLAGLLRQHREIGELKRAGSSEPLVNLPLALFGPGGTVRGQVETLVAPRTASHLLLLFEVRVPYPAYRLEILAESADVPIWESGELTRIGDAELSVALPRRLFASGEHRLRLYGLSESEADLLAEHLLRIEVEAAR